jgi:hypothetical protein
MEQAREEITQNLAKRRDRWAPGAYRASWPAQNGLERTAGDRGGGYHRADHL